MSKGFKKMVMILWIPLLVLVVLAGFFFWLGFHLIAWLICWGGAPLVCLVVLAYIVFVDSKKLFLSEIPWWKRLYLIITFQERTTTSRHT